MADLIPPSARERHISERNIRFHEKSVVCLERREIIVKKILYIILICLICFFTLTACTGYNNIMYKHLSNEENYETYKVSIEKIYVCNKETGRLEEYDEAIHDESYLNSTVRFGISEIDGFCGGEYILENGSKTDYIVLLDVLSDNSQLLVNSGFYNDFSVGDTIEIQSSNWIYMDTDFYYVIGVKYNGVQYLNSDDGLQNIIDMMDKDRSLF